MNSCGISPSGFLAKMDSLSGEDSGEIRLNFVPCFKKARDFPAFSTDNSQ